MQRAFTNEQEAKLLERYRAGNVTHRHLAIEHGVDQSTITRTLARAAKVSKRSRRKVRSDNP